MKVSVNELFYAASIPGSWRNCHGCRHLTQESSDLPSGRDVLVCGRKLGENGKPGGVRGVVDTDQNPISWSWSCKEVGPSENQPTPNH